jgi:nucleotidyltransferase/DNA polymerase involved in DNA repair
MKTIIHVDMDAFYASIEQRDHPELLGKPVIVGADPRGRGVVATASYEARSFGVHSAMPISEAYRCCPQGIYLPVDGERYRQVSRAIMTTLEEFSPSVEPLSLDEAFLDITGTERLLGPPIEVARSIKTRIRETTHLTASVGLAPNKFLAKVASDLNKPDGLVVVPPSHEAEFLAPLPIKRMWGVGEVVEAELQKMGIETIGRLARTPRRVLECRFGKSGGLLHELAQGHDDRPVEPWHAPKSMGAEETFSWDTQDLEALRQTLLRQSERVARELRAEAYAARTVTLKLRFANFHTITRRVTDEATQDGIEIFKRALGCWSKSTGCCRSGSSVSPSRDSTAESPISSLSSHRVQLNVIELRGRGSARQTLWRGRPDSRKPARSSQQASKGAPALMLVASQDVRFL